MTDRRAEGTESSGPVGSVNRKRGRDDGHAAGDSSCLPDQSDADGTAHGEAGVIKRQASGGEKPSEPPLTIATLLVPVPREAVGYIIGKGGETIKEMNAKSGAHVEVEKEDPALLAAGGGPPTRSFQVTGTKHQMDFAKALIAEKVTTVLQQRATISGGGASSAAATVPGVTPNFELWVPADRVGMVIGSGGAVIKQLQEKAGALIVVHNDRVDPAGQKLVTITGGATEAAAAKKLVMDIMRKPKPLAPASVPASSMMFPGIQAYPGYTMGFAGAAGGAVAGGFVPPSKTKVVRIPANCVGIVIGKRGETIRDLQLRSGAHVKVTPDSETSKDALDRAITITGGRAAMDLAHNMLNDLVNEGLQRNAARTPGQPSAGLNSPGQLTTAALPLSDPSVQMPPLLPSASIKVELAVANDKVGLIIGKGGATIRELQQRSGARIVVAKEEKTSRDSNIRQVTVTGPSAFVEAAKSLISEKVAGHHPALSVAGGVPSNGALGGVSAGVYPGFQQPAGGYGVAGALPPVYSGIYNGQYGVDPMAYYSAYAQAAISAGHGVPNVAQTVGPVDLKSEDAAGVKRGPS